MSKCTTALAAALLTVATVFADTGGYLIPGAGALACAQFLEARERQDESLDQVLLSWIQGFQSGVNVERTRTGRRMILWPDTPTTLAYLRAYCVENPRQPLFSAAQLLTQRLARRR